MTDEVRAAGGVVWRHQRDGDHAVEVAIVHRPRYDDWTLPKGKASAGESFEACAVREVHEETGLACSLGDDLGAIRYVDGQGRPKVVRYWSMEAGHGTFEPTDEVDEIRWFPCHTAGDVLTYDRDREVLARFRP